MFSTKDNKMINMAVKSMVYEQEKNGGRVPRGLIPDIVADLKGQGILVTRDILNGRLRRVQAKDGRRGQPLAVIAIHQCKENHIWFIDTCWLSFL